MSLRRKPNANRNFPQHCPYCAGMQLFPDGENEFAWLCGDCRRVFSVMFYGQDDPENTPQPSASTAQALRTSLSTHGHDHVATYHH